MNLSKFISLIHSSRLNLSRLNLLNDPHEGSTPTPLVEAWNTPELGSLSDINKNVPQSSYVSCWSLSDFESEALWRLYTNDADGIAIQTTYQKLIDIIEPDDKLYIGKVTYLDYETEYWSPHNNMFNPIMHKRRAFAHEKEVRLVKHLIEHVALGSTPGPLSIQVPINIDSLAQAIYISPYAPEWYADVVKSVVEKFAPSLFPKIKWSKMKNTPLY